MKKVRSTHQQHPKLLLTTPEAAVALRVSTVTIKRLRSSGRDPAYVRLGRLIRYPIGDLRRWINANRVISTEAQFRRSSCAATS